MLKIPLPDSPTAPKPSSGVMPTVIVVVVITAAIVLMWLVPPFGR